MEMSEKDICRDFMQAKNPHEQIAILADMNRCGKEEVYRVLVRNGTDVSGAISARNAAAKKNAAKSHSGRVYSGGGTADTGRGKI